MLAALVIGGLTAWYLGVQAGVIAAVATAGALLIAAFVPGVTLAVYALVVAWAGALYFLGPKMGKGKAGVQSSSLPFGIGAAASQASAWLKKNLGGKNQ